MKTLESRDVCKKCIKSYDGYTFWSFGGAIVKNSVVFNIEKHCHDCGRKSMCHHIANPIIATIGGVAESDEITKLGGDQLENKPKPVATNKRDAKKRYTKIVTKPKGGSNVIFRRKT